MRARLGDIANHAVIAALVALLLLVLPGRALGHGDTIRIAQIDADAHPTIDVYAYVENVTAAPLRDLTAKAFRVLEDGREVPFELVGIGASTAIVLVIDRSAAMTAADLEAAKGAATSFIERARLSDRIALISFGDVARVEATLDVSRASVLEAVRRIGGGGNRGVALYDATLEALRVLRPVGGRTAAIVLSSAPDDASRASLPELLAMASTEGVWISILGMSLRTDDQTVLQRIAAAASGDFAYVPSSGLVPRYLRIAEQLEAEYLLRYRTTQPIGDETRVVRVRVWPDGPEAGDIAADGAYSARRAIGVSPLLPAVVVVILAALGGLAVVGLRRRRAT